jgi:hypothetical protein
MSELVSRAASLNAEIESFPEYNIQGPSSDTPLAQRLPLVQGGFGALGNSSSFHNPFVRRMRADLHPIALALFRRYVGNILFFRSRFSFTFLLTFRN